MVRIAINGLGRIGRCVMRALEEASVEGLELVAVNGPADIEQHVHLLQYDSVHGTCPKIVSHDGESISLGNTKAKLLRERDPKLLPWKDLGIDMVLECSGKFNSKEEASQHLQAGAKKVLVSAPCKQSDLTIVYGVNHTQLQTQPATVISVGSCTTNCLAPVADILHRQLRIVRGFMTTIHAYTNDQNIVDRGHKDLRRARAAALSMIPTSTGAATSIGLVIPALAGKLGGAAVRVPTPNVSMIDFTCEVSKDTTAEQVNGYFKEAAHGALRGVLNVSSVPLVSIDYNRNPHSAVVDLLETQVIDKRCVRVVAWYDNEWAFSLRMLDVARYLGAL
jgi:glyceraldehyde 3-phosphate dehydrogenase